MALTKVQIFWLLYALGIFIYAYMIKNHLPFLVGAERAKRIRLRMDKWDRDNNYSDWSKVVTAFADMVVCLLWPIPLTSRILRLLGLREDKHAKNKS